MAIESEIPQVRLLLEMLAHEDYLSIIEHESTQTIINILQRNDIFSVDETTRPELNHVKLLEIANELNFTLDDLYSIISTQAGAFLQLFVASNFTGPQLDSVQEYNELMQRIPLYTKLNNTIKAKHLSVDTVDVYHLVNQPWLLFVVRQFMSMIVEPSSENTEPKHDLFRFNYYLWNLRYATIYSLVLLDPVESFVSRLKYLQDYIYSNYIATCRLTNDHNNPGQEKQTELLFKNIAPVELCCELIQSSLIRDDITLARKFMDCATDISGISIEATGVLGKRTRFQQKEVAQLVVKVTQATKDPNLCQITIADSHEVKSTNLPIDVKLDCDTLLPETQFNSSSGDPSNEASGHSDDDLSVESQILLLAMLNLSSKSEAVDENIATEYSAAYLHTIIRSSTVWCVSFKALVQRCNIEKKNRRKVDRALLQMEELIKLTTSVEYTSQKKLSDYFTRLRLFYCVLPQPNWSTQQNYGDISMDLGLFKNALEVFLRIELWEKVISCYQVLDMNQKAEALIRQELVKHETPYLYCLLGDATENIEFYEKAWILSNSRYARAKRSLGTHYYVRKRYDEAIKHYELASKVNPSNTGVLYMLAYSYLLLERYERAAQCYRSITQFDDSSFLAWNNLSKCYIKLKQKERAWRTLNEAIKCNFEEWRIWENLMLVSTDIGAFEDIINAWHRLIDLKSSHEDDQVLEILTDGLVRNIKDIYGESTERLVKKALKLVARLNATSGTSYKVWICYYRLLLKDFQMNISTTTSTSSTNNIVSEDNDGSGKTPAVAADNQLTRDKDKEFNMASHVDRIAHALQRANPSKLTADRNWFRIPEKVLSVLETYNTLADCHVEAYDILRRYYNSSETIRNRSGHELKPMVTQTASFRMSLNNICGIIRRQLNSGDFVGIINDGQPISNEIILNRSDETTVNANDNSADNMEPPQQQQQQQSIPTLLEIVCGKRDAISKLISTSNVASARTE